MMTHEKLAQMRKNAKLSRRELADISGFNEHTILAYERNQNPASYEYLEFCSLYFGYTQGSITAICYFKGDAPTNISYPPLEKMSEQEQMLKIYKKIAGLSNRKLYEMLLFINPEILTIYKQFKELQPTGDHIDELLAHNVTEQYIANLDEKEFSRFLELHNINPADYTPDKYAEFVKLGNITKKLEKKEQYSKQDLELLALLNSLDAEIKESLKSLMKTIIKKGGKM